MKKKSVLAVVLSLCLVAVVAIGATLALLSDKTNTVTNRFTVSQKGIDIDLKEPAWDGIDFGAVEAENPDDPALGINLAEDIVPGREIPKDPTVKNTGNHDAWVAIELEYLKEGAAAAFADIAVQADINFDTINWTEKTGSNKTVFYYNVPLAVDAETKTALFDTVTINEELEEVFAFDIKITAYAVQAEGVADLAAAQTQLDALIAAN